MKNKPYICIFLSLMIFININSPCAKIKSIAPDIQSDINTPENFLGLSSDKLAEDFDYYWQTMQENSPLFNISKRYIPDLETQFLSCKEKIRSSTSNFEQLQLIDNFSNFFLGHNGIISNRCSYLINELYGPKEKSRHRQTWAKTLAANPLTEKNTDMYNHYKFIENSCFPEKKEPNNVTTKIIKQNEIAYIKIASFDETNVDADRVIISKFFKDIENYKNLIIDITGNGGGSEKYLKLFTPILKKELCIKQYYLFNLGPLSKAYIEEEFRDEIQLIDKLPSFKNFNEKNKTDITHFAQKTIRSPASTEPFTGKIWVLIDEYVFSASEAFALICKSIDDITLVGRTTGGDGVSIDPAFIILPNSKVALRYSLSNGLNPDGSSNVEYGTQPDIISPTYEMPIVTCLKAIEKTSK